MDGTTRNSSVVMRGVTPPTTGRLSGRESRGFSPVRVYGRQQSEVNESFLRSARDGDLDLVLEHLDYGQADVNTCNQNGLAAIHLASKVGHVNVVAELLRRGAPVDSLTKKGNTSLHIATLAGHREIVDLLVKHGAKVNLQSKLGFTPLYMAAQENHAELVQYLLNHGADQHLATQDGFTPMSVANQMGHHTVQTLLMDNDESKSRVRLPALHAAAKRNDLRAAKLLLQKESTGLGKAAPSVNQVTKSGFTPLHLAAHYDGIDVGQLLIEHGAGVDIKAKSGITPLHVASKWGRVNMVRLLIESNADIDCRTKDLLTPLHCGARSGHESVVDLLLSRGASFNCKSKNGLTPLHMSTQGDHVECTRLLLTAGADINDVSLDYLTAIHVAAHCGNLKTAELLLKFKCNGDARALNGFTPLHVACKKSRFRIIELLLKYGANIECTTESGLTPLHVSAYMGFANVVTLLLDKGAMIDAVSVRSETSLHLATRQRHHDVIRILLRHRADVNATTNEQQTCLHIASRLGDSDGIRLLLGGGADCNLLTRDHYTPLHVAVKEGYDDVISLLLENGAKQNIKTKKGFTALHVAAKYGHASAAKLLLQHRGSNVNVEGKNGLTPLHVATHYNNLDVVLVLLENGANCHIPAKNGYTSLHIAAKRNHIDIAKVLMRYEAKAGVESKNGYTPLHLAAQEGHADMVALLLGPAGKADSNGRAKNGLTPMHLAAQEDHVHVAEVLIQHQGQVEPQTKAGYTPLHTACHFGQLQMIEYLLNHGAYVNSTTEMGYTPLHLSAQQGHLLAIKLLLKYNASPDALTFDGQSALSIAKHLGFVSITELLQIITEVMVATPAIDYHYNIVFPETMHELMMDSDEDGGDDMLMMTPGATFQYRDEEGGSPESSSNRKRGRAQEDLFSFEERSGRQSTMSWSAWSGHSRDLIADELHYMREEAGRGGAITPSSADPGDFRPYLMEDSESGYQTPGTDGMYTPGLMTPGGELDMEMRSLMRLESRPLADDVYTPGTSCVSSVEQYPLHPLHPARLYSKLARRALSEDMLDEDHDVIQRVHSSITSATQFSMVPDFDGYRNQRGSSLYSETSLMSGRKIQSTPVYSGFLVSFIVDARGAVMSGRRHSGVRVIIPPESTCEPTRITCKLVGKEKLTNPPQLAEGEALAARILDMGQAKVKFNGPVLIEVPHFASIPDNEREVCVMKSENGITWIEHTTLTARDSIHHVTGSHFEDLEPAEQIFDNKPVIRIVCTDFPQYFALVSRVRSKSKSLGPPGGILSSSVVPQVQVVFPEGAINKPIRVGLQALPVKAELIKAIVPETISLSASPIVTVEPRPRKFHQPITVTIPLPVGSSLRDSGKSKMQSDSLRLLCSMTGCSDATQWVDITGSTPLKLTDNCVSFTTNVSARFWLVDAANISADDVILYANLLFQELIHVPFLTKFVLYSRRHSKTKAQLRLFSVTDDKVEKSLEKFDRFAEVARSDFTEVHSGEMIRVSVVGMNPVVESSEQLFFHFVPLRENRFHIDVSVRSDDVIGQVTLIGRTPRVRSKALTVLAFRLPPSCDDEDGDPVRQSLSANNDGDWRTEVSTVVTKTVITKTELKLADIAERLDKDWTIAALQLGLTDSVIEHIKTDYDHSIEQSLVMLQTWVQQQGSNTSANELQRALKAIGRDDVIEACMTSRVEEVTDFSEEQQALAFFKQELNIPKSEGDDENEVEIVVKVDTNQTLESVHHNILSVAEKPRESTVTTYTVAPTHNAHRSYPVVEVMLPSGGSIEMEDVSESSLNVSNKTFVVEDTRSIEDRQVMTTQVVVEQFSDELDSRRVLHELNSRKEPRDNRDWDNDVQDNRDPNNVVRDSTDQDEGDEVAGNQDNRNLENEGQHKYIGALDNGNEDLKCRDEEDEIHQTVHVMEVSFKTIGLEDTAADGGVENKDERHHVVMSLTDGRSDEKVDTKTKQQLLQNQVTEEVDNTDGEINPQDNVCERLEADAVAWVVNVQNTLEGSTIQRYDAAAAAADDDDEIQTWSNENEKLERCNFVEKAAVFSNNVVAGEDDDDADSTNNDYEKIHVTIDDDGEDQRDNDYEVIQGNRVIHTAEEDFVEKTAEPDDKYAEETKNYLAYQDFLCETEITGNTGTAEFDENEPQDGNKKDKSQLDVTATDDPYTTSVKIVVVNHQQQNQPDDGIDQVVGNQVEFCVKLPTFTVSNSNFDSHVVEEDEFNAGLRIPPPSLEDSDNEAVASAPVTKSAGFHHVTNNNEYDKEVTARHDYVTGGDADKLQESLQHAIEKYVTSACATDDVTEHGYDVND